MNTLINHSTHHPHQQRGGSSLSSDSRGSGRGPWRRSDMILIVDDHKDTCEALQRLLERKGMHSTYVLSGDEAIEFCKTNRPDVVVLDDMMPGKSGMEVFHAFLKNPALAGVKVLFYSAVFDFKKQQ